jgi:xanthine dehydrogenase YagS FAD-binding subunit
VRQPGELILAIEVPASAAAGRSHYLKIRDRASFEFALVSCAVALDARDGAVRDVRLALGGVAHKPWRLPLVEASLQDGPASNDAFVAAAARVGEGAQPASQNAFKVKLAQRAVLRALQTVAA